MIDGTGAITFIPFSGRYLKSDTIFYVMYLFIKIVLHHLIRES